MTKIKILTIAVIALLVLNGLLIGSMLLHNKGNHKHQGPKQIVIEKLNFDQTQIADYENLIKSHRASIKSLDSLIIENKKKLYETLKSSSNHDVENKLIEDLNNLQHQVEQLNLNHFKDIKGICKEDQLDDFNDLTEEIQAMFSNHKSKSRKK